MLAAPSEIANQRARVEAPGTREVEGLDSTVRSMLGVVLQLVMGLLR